jgi:hypothetical protein
LSVGAILGLTGATSRTAGGAVALSRLLAPAGGAQRTRGGIVTVTIGLGPVGGSAHPAGGAPIVYIAVSPVGGSSRSTVGGGILLVNAGLTPTFARQTLDQRLASLINRGGPRVVIQPITLPTFRPPVLRVPGVREIDLVALAASDFEAAVKAARGLAQYPKGELNQATLDAIERILRMAGRG